MLDSILNFLENIPELYVLIVLLFFAYIENIFPPSPSDSVVIFAGTLIPHGNVHFISLLIITTIGSTLGFLTMFVIGQKFDKKIVETGKVKYVKYETIMKVEHWFQKWGYWMILINRFLSGTRTVISFFAGMSLLDKKKTTLLAATGSLIWNFVLIYSGYLFSDNWQLIYKKIDKLGYVILGFVILVSLLILFKNKWKAKKSTSD
ncbi:MAG: hypothetical protein A2X64_01890 [Ignavibacteria bacterium GWF2_33_9]|nr:MAG: hypothetical protein A2X64_01890 [Ignavibacteria bacterium GWF2_33_9]